MLDKIKNSPLHFWGISLIILLAIAALFFVPYKMIIPDNRPLSQERVAILPSKSTSSGVDYFLAYTKQEKQQKEMDKQFHGNEYHGSLLGVNNSEIPTELLKYAILNGADFRKEVFAIVLICITGFLVESKRKDTEFWKTVNKKKLSLLLFILLLMGILFTFIPYHSVSKDGRDLRFLGYGGLDIQPLEAWYSRAIYVRIDYKRLGINGAVIVGATGIGYLLYTIKK